MPLFRPNMYGCCDRTCLSSNDDEASESISNNEQTICRENYYSDCAKSFNTVIVSANQDYDCTLSGCPNVDMCEGTGRLWFLITLVLFLVIVIAFCCYCEMVKKRDRRLGGVGTRILVENNIDDAAVA